MRIAVIADTHDRLPEPVRLAIAAQADEIWHLGDVCEPRILEMLEATGIPIHLVKGNCDSERTWPESLDLERAGLRIRLVHIPPKRAPEGVDLLLHGHTHVPRDESIGGTRYLNPGCITRPNRGAPASYAWLELETKEAPIWSLVLV